MQPSIQATADDPYNSGHPANWDPYATWYFAAAQPRRHGVDRRWMFLYRDGGGVLAALPRIFYLVDCEAARTGLLHHVELWVPDLSAARPRWQWLLGSLGYEQFQSWDNGVSYRLGPTYIVLEQSPALIEGSHERRRPGLNHLAFHAGSRVDLDQLVQDSGGHGWNLMFQDRHPFAGGPDDYAAYLEDEDGYEVELVAG